MARCELCGGQDAVMELRYSYDHGYCSGTKTIMICNICDDSGEHLQIGETLFVRVGNKLFYEKNQDFGIMGCYEEVRSYEHFEYLKNERISGNFTRGIKW